MKQITLQDLENLENDSLEIKMNPDTVYPYIRIMKHSKTYSFNYYTFFGNLAFGIPASIPKEHVLEIINFNLISLFI